MSPALEPFGDTAWRACLPETGDGASRRALLEELRALPGVIDVVVSECHALVVLPPGAPLEGVREVIARTLARTSASAPDEATQPELREHRVRVRYDGADLAEVASASGMSPAEVVAIHSGTGYEVAAIGFLPGFAYLRALDPRLRLPRRTTPRPRVSALSVAIAGPYTGIYPFASPGGWHLLGTAVGFTPFDARKGAVMSLGDRVRFLADTDGAAP